MHRIRLPLLLAAALLAALALVACGDDSGGGDSDADPQQVLDDTFANDEAIDSGSFDLSVDITAEGDQGGSAQIGLGGPFDASGDSVPKFDVSADVSGESSGQDVDFSGGLTSTGDSAFVNYQDTDYEIPQQLFDQFSTQFEQLQAQSDKQSEQSSNFLKSLGIDPSAWLTNVQNEGTEDVEGSETVHVSGQADVPKLLADIQEVADKAGPAAQQLTPQQIQQAEDSIQSADFDVYSGVDDNLLRRLTASLEVTPSENTPGAPDSVSIDFDLTFSDVNEPQEISAPENPEPLSSLIQSNPLLQQLLSGIQSGGGAAGLGGLPQSGGSAAPPSGGASQEYLQCLQTAQGQDELQKCAELIQ